MYIRLLFFLMILALIFNVNSVRFVTNLEIDRDKNITSLRDIKYATERKFNSKYACIFLLFVCYIILLVLSAFRYNVGTDYQTYCNAIIYIKKGIDPSWLNYEPGFLFLNSILVNYTTTGQLLIIVTSFIIISLFFISFYKHSFAPFQSIYLFYSLYLFFMSLNIIRQFIAIGIFLLFFEFFYKSKTFECMVLIFIASLFHSSALLLIPFYFFQKKELKLFHLILILFGTVIVALSIDSIMNLFFVLFPKYSLYKSAGGGGSLINILMIVFVCKNLVYIKNKKYYNENEKKLLDFYISSLVFAFIISVFSYKIVFFARASYYFFAIIVFAIPFCSKCFKGKIENTCFTFFSFLFSTSVFLYYLNNNMAEVFPYNLWKGDI